MGKGLKMREKAQMGVLNKLQEHGNVEQEENAEGFVDIETRVEDDERLEEESVLGSKFGLKKEDEKVKNILEDNDNKLDDK